MKHCDFVTFGDSNFFPTLLYNAQSVKTIYPESTVYIYDWGLTASRKQQLQELGNVAVIPWEKRFIDLSFDFSSLRIKLIKIYGIRKISDFLSCILHPTNITKNNAAFSFVKKEMLLANKLFCIRDFLNQYGGNFVLLDGDAVLLRPINTLLESSTDIGVTIKDPAHHTFRRNECSVINSGVCFFLGGTTNNKAFLDAWIDYLYKTHEYLAEQTSLVRLLQNQAPEILNEPNKTASIKLTDGTRLTVKTLPYLEYNNYKIEETGVLPETKIAHFKGNRYKENTFYTLLRDLGIEDDTAITQ